MKLTQQQINHFNTFGYLVIRQLFNSDEMKMISDGILALAILSLLAWSNALVLLLLIGLLGMMIFGY